MAVAIKDKTPSHSAKTGQEWFKDHDFKDVTGLASNFPDFSLFEHLWVFIEQIIKDPRRPQITETKGSAANIYPIVSR